MSNTARITPSTDPFRELLVKKVQFDKLYSVCNIATWLNIPEKTIYNYLAGRSYFPPGLIAVLYNHTKDIDFLNVIIGVTDQRLSSKRLQTNGRTGGEELQEVLVELGKTTEEYLKAIEDGFIDEHELKKIKRRISCARRELDELEHCVETERK